MVNSWLCRASIARDGMPEAEAYTAVQYSITILVAGSTHVSATQAGMSQAWPWQMAVAGLY